MKTLGDMFYAMAFDKLADAASAARLNRRLDREYGAPPARETLAARKRSQELVRQHIQSKTPEYLKTHAARNAPGVPMMAPWEPVPKNVRPEGWKPKARPAAPAAAPTPPVAQPGRARQALGATSAAVRKGAGSAGRAFTGGLRRAGRLGKAVALAGAIGTGVTAGTIMAAPAVAAGLASRGARTQPRPLYR